MSTIGRRRLTSKAREQAGDTMAIKDPAAEVGAQMDRLVARGTAARLVELEDIHADEIAAHRKVASDYAALIEALHARSPQEWHIGEPATAGLAYLRHLEDEADRCGIDRRPPWYQDAGSHDAGLTVLPAVVADFGYYPHPGLPVPPPTAPETAEDTKDPGSGSAPPVDEAAETTPASADPEPVTTEDEPAAEADCAEDGAA